MVRNKINQWRKKTQMRSCQIFEIQKNAVVQNQFYHAKYLILLPHNFIISVSYLKKNVTH